MARRERERELEREQSETVDRSVAIRNDVQIIIIMAITMFTPTSFLSSRAPFAEEVRVKRGETEKEEANK